MKIWTLLLFIFSVIITIKLITMKVAGTIDWSWWFIFAPLWGPYVLHGLVILIIVLLAVLVSSNRR